MNKMSENPRPQRVVEDLLRRRRRSRSFCTATLDSGAKSTI
jgi:hypothetical protein